MHRVRARKLADRVVLQTPCERNIATAKKYYKETRYALLPPMDSSVSHPDHNTASHITISGPKIEWIGGFKLVQ
eukprot:1359919-Rhodomonas_salina.5